MERSEGDTSLKNPVTPPGIDPGTVRLVAQRLNHCGTPDPGHHEVVVKIHKNESILGGTFLFMNFHDYLTMAV
jgi:hypothetical protein